MALPLGQMRDRFVVETIRASQDAYGENRPVYDGTREVWGYLRTLTGRQLQLTQASTVTSTATHQITIRYAPEVTVGKTRLRLATADSTRAFVVNAINDTDNRHVEMILTVTEVVA